MVNKIAHSKPVGLLNSKLKEPFPDELWHIEAFYGCAKISKVITWISTSMGSDILLTDTSLYNENTGPIFNAAIAGILHRWLALQISHVPLAIKLTECRLINLRRKQNMPERQAHDYNTMKELLGTTILNTLHLLVLFNEDKNAVHAS